MTINNNGTIDDANNEVVVEVDAEETPVSPIEVQAGLATLVDENALDIAAPEAWREKMPKAVRDLYAATPELMEGQLAALVDNLPTADAEKCREMFEALNPVREGVVASTADVRIPSLQIFQGIGDNPALPDGAPVGSVFSSNRELLACFDAASARANKVGTSITVAVLLIVKSRTWWKPKRATFVVPHGVDPASKAPICQSPDRVTGTRYGTCAACPNKPFAKGSYDPDACSDDATVYVVVKGFKGIYSIGMKGASLKLAVAAIERSKGKLWDTWYDLTLAPQTNASGKWYVFSARSHATDEAPHGLQTTALERNVFKALSAMMLHEAVTPQFARVYNPKTQELTAQASEGLANPAAIADAARADMSSSGTL